VTPETLFVEAWKAGVELKPDGDRLLLDAPSKPPQELLDKLAKHKSEMLRFLAPHAWIETPLGPAKLFCFLGWFRCGVVLRKRPDTVTWMQKSQLGLAKGDSGAKPSAQDLLKRVKMRKPTLLEYMPVEEFFCREGKLKESEGE